MNRRAVSSLFILVMAISVARAQPPPALQDSFLDNFVGDWRVERKMGSGRIVQTAVHGEWALKHQFIQLHYGSAGAAQDYEALVFIGFDATNKSYVCHWMDFFGGSYTELGHGTIDSTLLALEFRFVPKEGELTNKFTFDPKAKSWTSLIRQREKGEWKTFAEEKWTKK